MDISHVHTKGCVHDGYYSGMGLYSREAQTIRYVLICDDCGAEMQEVCCEAYRPDPILDA